MSHSFHALTPEGVMRAAELCGFFPTGEFQQLNSYENRVFDLRMEPWKDPISGKMSAENLIFKFYRPGRWSLQALAEEHRFLEELLEEHISLASPLRIGTPLNPNTPPTLSNFDGVWFSVFPKLRGRMPQELMPKDLFQIGILLAHLHIVGSQRSAPARPFLGKGILSGWEALNVINCFLAPELRVRYREAAAAILEFIEENVDQREFIRIHGDCHRGNILQTGDQYALVDFDDFCNGPVIQDFWMLLSGDPDFEIEEREQLMAGYEEICNFPAHQWDWVPALRGLRVILYAAWIGRRWDDPSFPRIFPEFGTYNYWAEEVETLEKIAWNLI